MIYLVELPQGLPHNIYLQMVVRFQDLLCAKLGRMVTKNDAEPNLKLMSDLTHWSSMSTESNASFLSNSSLGDPETAQAEAMVILEWEKQDPETCPKLVQCVTDPSTDIEWKNYREEGCSA